MININNEIENIERVEKIKTKKNDEHVDSYYR